MARKYLLTITDDEGSATENVSENDAMDILASFGVIGYTPGTFNPNPSRVFLIRKRLERGEEIPFTYNDVVTNLPVDGKISLVV